MQINIKITEETFAKIMRNAIKSITHGYSCNKKYLRLFDAKKGQEITFISDKFKTEIKRKFQSISIFEKDGKKFFELKFI